MPVDEKEEGRFSRWSRRKLAEVEHEDEVSAEVVTDEETRDAELLANREAAEAIDLESLTEDSDFSVFMKEGVPKLLKRKALAALWRSNPILANVDGLVDYDDDFGSPDLIMKTFKSAYQAGRGYMEHVERLARVEAEENAEEGIDVSDATDEPLDTKADAEEVAEPDGVASVEGTGEGALPDDEEAMELLPNELDAADVPVERVSLRRRFELEEQA